MADWEKIKAEYLTTEISIRELAQKHGVHYTTIAKKSSKEDWQTQRQQQANKTLTKMLAADTKNKADRVARLNTVADKLLRKVEVYVDVDGPISPTSIKNLSDALKNIKEVQMIRTEQDILEQEARIAKLQKEAQKEDKDQKSITIKLEGGLSDYAQ